MTSTSKRSKELGITFGAFAPSIESQIAEQFPDIKIPIADLSRLERLREALILLSIHVLSETSKQQAQKALMRKITTAVKAQL